MFGLYLGAYFTLSGDPTYYIGRCYRTDLLSGDVILIKDYSKTIEVIFQKYVFGMGYPTGPTLICKLHEGVLTEGHRHPPSEEPIRIGLSTYAALADELKNSGWTREDNARHTYIFSAKNDLGSAKISLFDLWIDIEFNPHPDSLGTPALPSSEEGMYVRHKAMHNTFNLLEGISRFSKSFLSNEPDLSKYFIPVKYGVKPKGVRLGNPTLLVKAIRSANNDRRRSPDRFDRELYSTLGGDGERVYLTDGLYLNEDGSWADEGR